MCEYIVHIYIELLCEEDGGKGERERKKDALRYVSDKDGKFQKICWYISEQDDEKQRQRRNPLKHFGVPEMKGLELFVYLYN